MGVSTWPNGPVVDTPDWSIVSVTAAAAEPTVVVGDDTVIVADSSVNPFSTLAGLLMLTVNSPAPVPVAFVSRSQG